MKWFQWCVFVFYGPNGGALYPGLMPKWRMELWQFWGNLYYMGGGPNIKWMRGGYTHKEARDLYLKLCKMQGGELVRFVTDMQRPIVNL